MRILSTFNDRIYKFSGKKMIETVRQAHPDDELWIYKELEDEKMTEQVDREIPLRGLPEYDVVFSQNKDVIDPIYGGTGEGLAHWNRRWFGWFKKLLMQYDAILRNRHHGLNIFIDADVRFIRPLTEEFLEEQVKRPVALFKGLKDTAPWAWPGNSVESGVIVVDGTSEFAIEFYRFIMDLFTSQKFRRLPRWDDSYILAKTMEKFPHMVQDLAEGVTPDEYTNLNGHTTTGQVIPFTKWNSYLEHDKGIHLRNEIE